MKEKLLYWIGAALLALSAVVLAFVFTDWQIAVCAISCCVAPLALFTLVACCFRPYEYLLYAAGVLSSVLLLLMECCHLFICLPMLVVIIILIINKRHQKSNVIKLILVLVIQLMFNFLLMLAIDIHDLAKKLENTPYRTEIISNIEDYSQTYKLIMFEDLNCSCTLNAGCADLLKPGDSVQVKILNNHIYDIKRH